MWGLFAKEPELLEWDIEARNKMILKEMKYFTEAITTVVETLTKDSTKTRFVTEAKDFILLKTVIGGVNVLANKISMPPVVEFKNGYYHFKTKRGLIQLRVNDEI